MGVILYLVFFIVDCAIIGIMELSSFSRFLQFMQAWNNTEIPTCSNYEDQFTLFYIVFVEYDRLYRLVVRAPGYRYRGPGFSCLHYQIF
jgi:hypothetical protein